MRLAVAIGRIKDQDRASMKLAAMRQEKPDLRLDRREDVEAAIRDLVGMKMLCKSPRDQRLIVEHLRSIEKIPGIEIVEEPKDYVTMPKPSGYRAVHLHLSVQVAGSAEPVMVELQVKTRLQDAWGELTHEDLYKPDGGLRQIPFHERIARSIADQLATVDGLADQLADEIEATMRSTEQEAETLQADDTVTVTVCSTGPRYALAEDDSGRRGLIPAYAVRKLAGRSGLISVDEFLERDNVLDARVIDNEKGVFYLPVALP
jgi:putative GTP pyrophosphokinase